MALETAFRRHADRTRREEKVAPCDVAKARLLLQPHLLAKALDQASFERVGLVARIGGVEGRFFVLELFVVVTLAEEFEDFTRGVARHRFAEELMPLVEERFHVLVHVGGRVLPHGIHRLEQYLCFGHGLALGFVLQCLRKREPAEQHAGQKYQREQQRELGRQIESTEQLHSFALHEARARRSSG
jgi:hypothetical protein